MAYDNSGRSVSSMVRSFSPSHATASKIDAQESNTIYATQSMLRVKSEPETSKADFYHLIRSYKVTDVISMLGHCDLNIWQYVVGLYSPYSWEYKIIKRAYKRALRKENNSKHELFVEDQIAAIAAGDHGIKLETSFENSLAAKLSVFQIPFSTHTKHFKVTVNGTDYTFSPDFYIPVAYHGRRVLAEVHSMNYFTPTYLEILREFMDSRAAEEYYFILITNARPKKKNTLRIMMNKHGYNEEDICDKLIYIKYNQKEHMEINLKDENGSVYRYLSILKEHSKPMQGSLTEPHGQPMLRL